MVIMVTIEAVAASPQPLPSRESCLCRAAITAAAVVVVVVLVVMVALVV